MNILIRVDSTDSMNRIQTALNGISFDFYFVRDDRHMLSVVGLGLVDAVVLDTPACRKPGRELLKLLRANVKRAGLPVICCDTRELQTGENPSRLARESAFLSSGATSYIDCSKFDQGGFKIEMERLLSRVEVA
ncbi:MAG: hypothetical protein IT342_04200 [Candidatus Melainabacteria bacterium]|nr:hypothetical protein [Candidatus Melainabacteria bacterium]